MARASREDADATARRILEVATSLFAHHGYADVAIETVAAQAGVTRGAVYHHYRNKSGLFTAVVVSAHEHVADAVVEAAERAAQPWDALVAGSHAFLDASTDPRTRRVLLVDAPAVLGWESWRALDATHSEKHLHDALADLEKSGAVAPGSAATATTMLSGAINAAALAIAADADTAPAYHAMLDRLLDALRAPVALNTPRSGYDGSYESGSGDELARLPWSVIAYVT